MPNFGIAGGLGLALVRGISVAACLAVLGTIVFQLIVAPPALALMDASLAARFVWRWRRLLWTSLAIAALAGALWLLLASGRMAGVTEPGAMVAAVPLVIQHSRFGAMLATRLGLLAGASIALTARPHPNRLVLAASLAGAAAALQALVGHAASVGGALMDWLALSTLFHVLAAGLWLGQLPSLWRFLADAPPAAASLALRRFSPLGAACVLVLAATALAQGWGLVGGLAGAVGTAYGWADLAKLSLFVVLLAIAAINRFALMPKLEASDPAAARRALCRSVMVETAVGLAIILVAGILASLPPGAGA